MEYVELLRIGGWRLVFYTEDPSGLMNSGSTLHYRLWRWWRFQVRHVFPASRDVR